MRNECAPHVAQQHSVVTDKFQDASQRRDDAEVSASEVRRVCDHSASDAANDLSTWQDRAGSGCERVDVFAIVIHGGAFEIALDDGHERDNPKVN